MKHKKDYDQIFIIFGFLSISGLILYNASVLITQETNIFSIGSLISAFTFTILVVIFSLALFLKETIIRNFIKKHIKLYVILLIGFFFLCAIFSILAT